VNLIEHPSLVQVSDVGVQPDKSAYLVMEFLRGESLAARRRRTTISTQTVLQIAWQIADGLAAAHQKRIVHRDIKPQSVRSEAGWPSILPQKETQHYI
jgi:serine/threonine protein kinase